MADSYPPEFNPEQIDALRRAAKEGLRQRCAGLRRALSADARQERAAVMCNQLVQLEAFQKAHVISTYAPLKFEIDPSSAIDQALSAGKVLALPRVVPGTRELELFRYLPGDTLLESGFAVREPLPTATPVNFDSVDVVLVPGLAFDVRGQRLGYGQGFYDRLLPRLGKALRVGLCFELSLLVEVPATEQDVPVDVIVTDKRVIRCER